MEFESSFVCAYCFQINHILVDPSLGTHQEYVEDCQVCCRPNRLTIVVDEERRTAETTADVE